MILRRRNETAVLLDERLPEGWHVTGLHDGAQADWVDPRRDPRPTNQRTVLVERRPQGSPRWWATIRDYLHDGEPVALDQSGAATQAEAAAEAARLARVHSDRRTEAEAASDFDFGLGGRP